LAISVFLADDNLIVREGVKALLDLESDLDVIGVAADFDELVDGAEAANPQVVVTDIRMPPNFTREGIEAAKMVRKRHPGTGIVILSQYDDPEYAVSLLSDGAAGYAYMLKDRVGEGNQLANAIREVAAGGSVLDPKIVDALASPLRSDGVLSASEEDLLQLVAEGTPIKAIASTRQTTPADVDAAIEGLFVKLAEGLSAGQHGSLERLKRLHRAIMEREEQGETLGRLLPGGVAQKLREEGRTIGASEELEVTVLMSDIRGFTTIAEHTDPSKLATQLNEHRAAMSRPIIDNQGTIMQFAGDSVMAVFGAPFPVADHADLALAAAEAMHAAQAAVNASWEEQGLEPFGLGIGLSTGPVAAALIGSEERLEYTVIGDVVNLTQRIQQWAEPGETVISDPTWEALTTRPKSDALEPALVKGREAPVSAHRFPRRPALHE
jgi:class 3 adenylate cyclase/DNA-binding NarL/FixJ family response regulator